MPIRDRLRAAEDRYDVGRDEALQCDAAHVDEFEIVAVGHEEHAAVEEAVAIVGALFDCAFIGVSGIRGRLDPDQSPAVVVTAVYGTMRDLRQPIFAT